MQEAIFINKFYYWFPNGTFLGRDRQGLHNFFSDLLIDRVHS